MYKLFWNMQQLFARDSTIFEKVGVIWIYLVCFRKACMFVGIEDHIPRARWRIQCTSTFHHIFLNVKRVAFTLGKHFRIPRWRSNCSHLVFRTFLRRRPCWPNFLESWTICCLRWKDISYHRCKALQMQKEVRKAHPRGTGHNLHPKSIANIRTQKQVQT